MEYNDKTEIIDINYNKTKKDIKRTVFRTIPVLFIPVLFTLSIVSLHSNELIKNGLNYVLYGILCIFLYFFIIGFFIVKKKKKKNRFQKIINFIYKMFIIIYVFSCITFTFLLYGPYNNFRTWLISTAMSTMNHQYLCKWFYNDKEINKIIGNNYIKEVDEDTNTGLIDMKEETYENEYEKQILKRNKNDKYKIIEFLVNGQKAYLAAIYDPSKVKVAVTSSLGKYGQYVTKMAEDNNAILAVNGGGFYDPGNNSTGGMPTGITIKDGKIITNNNYSSYTQSGGLIGITNDNKLVLMKNTSAQKAIASGVRDGVSWGPFLIVNGKKAFIKGNGGWGYAARTAIGQRKDGIILLLVVDSNSTRTKGADMVHLTEIMSNYGAVNAANLDGGTSSVIVLPKDKALKYINECVTNYCYINDPVDSILRHKTRGIATSLIVTK